MSYSSLETSTADGSPVFLYEFKQGDGVEYRFTSDLLAVSHAGHTWQPLQITHAEPTIKSEIEADNLKIEIPVSVDFAASFLGYQPDIRTSLTIYRKQRDAAEVRMVWKGYVGTPTANGGTLSIECATVATWLKQSGLQSKMTRPCRHTVYFGGCRASLSLHSFAVTITGVSGRAVAITDPAGLDVGKLVGGILIANDGEQRMITDHGAGLLTLSRPLDTLAAGQTVQCARGCQRTRADCAEFQNPDNESGTNIENFGGFPWIPTKNPFAGGTIF